ncbi:ABC transporter permease subunit [Deinococcus cellulosilyticus]|uniref:Maltose/maltodextrin transport system permease protein n=1 Tax=Deinococcus cellulosilyticus (strain DSM 18568 / NBRC 106333 / KACC 11606 / 5516J-15) TaxID=1223518 RepID=A0A511N438_DEIC1|nr:ABC transporter permease subunit [Deinococcus cellulosilyticus]GEM47141.1 maltose ABC transporter permease [Deinococcus cellulosilyticus NBRC 106333 = KACC 11606]
MTIRTEVPPQGTRGLLQALGILAVLLLASLGIAWLIGNITASSFPQAPSYMLLVYWAIILVPLAVVILRAFPWMINWYYLLPAIIFVLTFTAFPLALTVGLAFTNYSGQNGGTPDSGVMMEIASISPDRKSITVTEPGEDTLQATFRCETADCKGAKAAVFIKDITKPVLLGVESLNDKTITLTAPLPENQNFVQITRVNQIKYVGIKNFIGIFRDASIQLIPTFIWTVVFALSTILINTAAGLTLGILLANKRLKFRNFYRSLLFLPWAIPVVISVQMWVALLNPNFGVINRMLGLLGMYPIGWLIDPLWAKISILFVNLWLGFPFMMTATISALASIPEDLYEAASIDGANRWQQVKAITLPMLRSAFTPLLLSGFAFNFNNFGLIYLLTAGGPPQEGRTSTAQSTDILLSWGYNVAFTNQGGNDYALASAIAIIIGILTLAVSIVNFRFAGVFKEARK